MTHILVVDDKYENIYLLRALLQGSGCTVDEARHGAEALDKARQKLPDLIISDLLMPVMDGYTLLRQWKSDEHLRSIPFVVYTATYTEAKDERLALDLGADAFILKPSEPEPFMARIHEVLRRQRQVTPIPVNAPKEENEVLLQQYNQVLIRKLEDKSALLEKTNLALQEDIAQRKRSEIALVESERKLRLVIDGLGPSLFVGLMTPNGQLIAANRPALEAAGLAPEDVLGKPFEETYWWSYSTSVQTQLRATIERAQRGEPSRYDVPIRVLEGKTIWIDFSLQPVVDGQAHVIFMVPSATVINDRKEAEQRLKESEARYRAIFDGVGVSLWEQDFSELHVDVTSLYAQHHEGLHAWFDAHPETLVALAKRVRVIDINLASLVLFGAETKEELLTGFTQIYVPESLPVFRDALVAFARGELSFTVEALACTLKGARLNLLVTLSVVCAAQPWERVLVSLVDITEMRNYRNHLEERVAHRTALLQTANKELESFSYSVSHDLRAPLRGIAGFSQALQEEYGSQLDDTAQGYLDRVQRASLHMGELLDAMLRLSRVSRSEIKYARVDISALAQLTVDGIRQANPERTVDVTIAPGMTAMGDATLVRAVLQNLLDNAWKYTARTSHARIEFRIVTRDATSVFCVSDNGAGFDMKYAERLFSPFQRLHSSSEFAGTGVGLATVERIIRRHGGRIWAEAEVGKGARFYFTLGKPPK